MKLRHGRHWAVVLLIGSLLLTGCSTPLGETGQLLEVLGNFFDLSKSSEEIFSTSLQEVDQDAENDGADNWFRSENAEDNLFEGDVAESSTETSVFGFKSSQDYQDYLSDKESLFQNRASWYYYYTQLTEEEQKLYDGLWAIVQDPTSTEYHKRVEILTDPGSEAFEREIARAYEALIFDHPELFWFRQKDGNIKYYYQTTPNLSGVYAVMLQLSDVYENYETEMRAFNEAVETFMAGIDLSQSEPLIALQIHDRLIDLVSYDDELAGQLSSSDNSYDYGYSAYGALVANSRGERNTAVCDGYTYAYEYLLQQAGITVTRVGGMAGENAENLEPHSWNLICYDEEWYEVDPTWNDQDADYDMDNSIIAEAVNNTTYWNRIRHFMYNLTTEQISVYYPDDSYTYYAAQGYVSFLGSSVHIRDDGSNEAETGDYLSRFAPVANGTTYTYDYLLNLGYSYSSSGSGSAAYGELILYDADGDGIPDDPSYRDDDGDGWVDW